MGLSNNNQYSSQPREANTVPEVINGKEPVVITGYPKSGNTWVTRLCAELLGCPVSGFWNLPFHNEIAVEGETRKSNYECFKAHSTVSELREHDGLKGKVIYIFRDPRDVVVSGANYFWLPRYESLYLTMRRIPKGGELYRKFVDPVLSNDTARIQRMTEIVCSGNELTNPFLKHSWPDHIKASYNEDCHMVQFEQLKSDPLKTVLGILEYLEVSLNENLVERAIYNQSFSKKKDEFKSSNQIDKSNFLRSGRSGEGMAKLSEDQLKKIDLACGDFMNIFGYKR